MDISNTPNVQERAPLSVPSRIFCCIILFLCSGVIPVLPFYINQLQPEQAFSGFTVPAYIGIGTLVLCAVFFLIYCRKPVFLACAAIATVLIFVFSPYFSVLFLALLGGAIAGAALMADARGYAYALYALPVIAAYAVAFFLTGSPILAMLALLPACAAIALGICTRKKISIIVTIGTVTAALAAAIIIFLTVDLLVAGMPFSIEGIKAVIKDVHAWTSAQYRDALTLMMELSEEWAAQISQMFGGEVTPEKLTEFCDSVASATLGFVPGTAIMLLWLFSFIAQRGYTALLVKNLPKQSYPKHLIEYAPSVPTAVFLILCYAVLLISALLPNGETVAFIAINVLLVLIPLLSVSGLLSIIANIKHATFKWPLILTYVIAVIFLGIGIIPMLSFFGAFGVIMQALAKLLEKKMNSSNGGQ